MIRTHLLEEGADGLLVHGKVEVARHEDQEVIGTGLLGEACLGNNVSCAVAGGAHGDDQVGATKAHSDLTGELQKSGLVFSGESDGLAVCAGNDDCIWSVTGARRSHWGKLTALEVGVDEELEMLPLEVPVNLLRLVILEPRQAGDVNARKVAAAGRDGTHGVCEERD